MPGYGVPDKSITSKMRRDCFTVDGHYPFDVLPLWKRGGGYYGQYDGRRDSGLLAEAVGAICIDGEVVYMKKAWQRRTGLKQDQIKKIISNCI